MNMAILTIAVFVVTFQCLLSFQRDYYWRAYTGTIPTDALVASNDINGSAILIGQAYIDKRGLIVSEIFREIREVCDPVFGKKKTDRYVDILCGSQENVYWFPANSTHLDTQISGRKAIIGGHPAGGSLQAYIGRTNYDGNIKFGKIDPFNTGHASLRFCHKGEEKTVDSYEILLYNKTAIM